MNEFCKLFLHIIIKNQNIVFFPIPNKKFNEQIEQIKAKLFNLNYTYLSSDAKVSMSDNALHSLLKLMNETEFQMKETSKKVSTELDSLYKSQIKTKCG